MTFATAFDELDCWREMNNRSVCSSFDTTATAFPYGVGDKNDSKITLALHVARVTESQEVEPPYSHLVQGKAYFRNEKAVTHAKSSTFAAPSGAASTPDCQTSIREYYHRVTLYDWQTLVTDSLGGLIAGPDEQIYAEKLSVFTGSLYGWVSVTTHITAYLANFKQSKMCVLGFSLSKEVPLSDKYWESKSPQEFFDACSWDKWTCTSKGDYYNVKATHKKFSPCSSYPDYQSRYATIAELDFPRLQDFNSEAYEARGSIVTRMADQAGRMTQNNLALIGEIVDILSTVIQVLRGQPNAIQKFKAMITDWPKMSLKKRAKVLANLRLSEQYGIKLTVQDITTLVSFYDDLKRKSDLQIARSATNYNVKTSYGIVHMDEHWKCFWSARRAYAPAIASLLRDDLIGFQNLWDLIPYSFVVDWFAPVGEILQAWDDEVMMSKMSIDCISVGIKSSMRVVDLHDGWTFTTDVSYYSRSPRSSFPPYAYLNSRDGINANVIINGAALIVQRL